MENQVWEFCREGSNALPIRFSEKTGVLGSDGDSDIIIMHPSVAPSHARLEIQEDGLAIYDLGSETGIFVNDRKENAVLLPAEMDEVFKVAFGKVVFLVVRAAQNMPPPLPEGTAATPSPGGGEIKGSLLSHIKKPKMFMKNPVSPVQGKAVEKNEDPDCIWYYTHDGVDYGPVIPFKLFEAVDAGTLLRDDRVWKEGMKTKVPAFKVKGLFDDDINNVNTGNQASSSSKDSYTHASPSEGPGMADSGHGCVTCPCCWFKFEPDEALCVSMHPDLIGDPVLGQDEQLRFLPERFTPDGLALDGKGMRCTDMACPRCHMRIPSQILHSTPFFLSIVGAPGSGKSHVLAAGIWRLREVLPDKFGFSFNDVDAVTNHWLNQYEENLFFDQESESLNPIVKTDETAAHVYKQVKIDGLQVFLPMPCMFTFSDVNESGPPKNCLVLYDNAGENFQVGRDSVNQPGTQHLIRSEGVLFLYDPVSDPRMRKHLKEERGLSYIGNQSIQRQDVLLVEMISRIRRHAGLTEGDHYDKPLILGLSKADLFGETFDFEVSPLREDPDTGAQVLDLQVIAEASYRTRKLMKRFAPEVVNSVESFARKVIYLPVSALGHNPDEKGIHLDHFKPQWVEIPFLYFLAHAGILAKSPAPAPSKDIPYTLNGHMLRFQSEETGKTHEVPWQYAGHELTCEETSKRFQVPHVDGAPVL